MLFIFIYICYIYIYHYLYILYLYIYYIYIYIYYLYIYIYYLYIYYLYIYILFIYILFIYIYYLYIYYLYIYNYIYYLYIYYSYIYIYPTARELSPASAAIFKQASIWSSSLAWPACGRRIRMETFESIWVTFGVSNDGKQYGKTICDGQKAQKNHGKTDEGCITH